jgi:hypothetical protein
MAYIGKEDCFPLWLPESLPEDILVGSYITLTGADPGKAAPSPDSEPSCGFIIQDWFGPFLLSPPSRSLRGQC